MPRSSIVSLSLEEFRLLFWIYCWCISRIRMPLHVNGRQIPLLEDTFDDLESFMKIYSSSFEAGSNQLKAKDVTKVSDKDGTLYLNQREYAVISGDSSVISKLGSDMATTCHIVVLYHKDTKIAALGHFDGMNTSQGVTDMLCDTIREVNIRTGSDRNAVIEIDLHIVGGFKDGRCLSEELSIELLKEFHQYSNESGGAHVRVHLVTLCVSELNNVTIENNDNGIFCGMINSPVIFGIVCDAKTGELRPAVFEEDAKLPVPDVRSSRSVMGVKFMPNIYRIHDNAFVLKPFTYEPFQQVELWSQQPDHIIKKYMSTSPEVEPDNFCDHIRATLKFVHKNPDVMKSVFHDKEALVFEAKIIEGRLTWHSR